MSRQKVVILDFGHGGIDPASGLYVTAGKRSPIWDDGSIYYEGVGNRDIGKRLSQWLRNDGWLVLYTVDPNDYKDVSLRERIRRSNAHYKKHQDAFQISIHSNAFTNRKANGAEIWTSIGLTESDSMATIIMIEHLTMFPDLTPRFDKSDGDLDKEGHLAMNRVNCPSVLIETMFHTNREECRILQSSEGREKIAIGLAAGCDKIYKMRA